MLREDFAYFSNAYSHGNATPFAFPGIIAGHPVIGNGRFPETASTIGELISGHSSGFSNNGHLTTERGYNRGFDSFHDQYPPDHSPSGIDRLKSIETLQNSELAVRGYQTAKKVASAWNGNSSEPNGLAKPAWSADRVADYARRRVQEGDSFTWAHFMDPHRPFTPEIAVNGPEIDRSYDELVWLNDGERTADPPGDDGIELLEQLYEANIRYLDVHLARLLHELRTLAWYEEALIVVVGDHGELFGEHGYMWHPTGSDPFDELLETPLLIKYPDGKYAGSNFDHLVQHRDILPTIADEIGDETSRISDEAKLITDDGMRHVVSKSNAVVRLVEPGGSALKRRDGTQEGLQTLSSEGRETLEAAEFPRVESLSGSVNGIADAERTRQLKALGYR